MLDLLFQPTPVPVISTPAPDFFRDPVWDFIAVILAAVAFLFGIFTYIQSRRNRPIKRLTPIVDTHTSLVSIREEEELKGRLVVLFDKKPIQEPDISTMIIRFVNTGTVPIDDEDYSGSIAILCGSEAEVLTANVVATNPNRFDAKADKDPNDPTRALLHPVLLNAGQSVTIKILVRKAAREVDIFAHIKGVEVEKPITKLGGYEYFLQKWDERSAQEGVVDLMLMIQAALGIIVIQESFGSPEWGGFMVALSIGLLIVFLYLRFWHLQQSRR